MSEGCEVWDGGDYNGCFSRAVKAQVFVCENCGSEFHPSVEGHLNHSLCASCWEKAGMNEDVTCKECGCSISRHAASCNFEEHGLCPWCLESKREAGIDPYE